jgi:hypothetical protein
MCMWIHFQSRDVTFFENIFPMKKSYGMSSLPTNLIADTSSEHFENFDHAENTPKPIHEEIDSEAPIRSKGPSTAKSFGDDFTVYHVFASPNVGDYKEVVHSEMNSILSNEIWELVDQPYGCKPMGYKWVFKKKLSPDGTIDKYKARLVTKGYT